MSTRIDAVGIRCLHTEQPRLVSLRTFTLKTYGGVSLGIDACRRTRNGSGLSVHVEGRAFDWWAPNRAALDAFFSFLVQNANALCIQAIHDYDNSRRWTAAKGWYRADIGPYPHHHETHVEVNWDGARDGRPIDQVIGWTPVPQPTPTPSLPVPMAEEDDEEDKVIIQPGKSRDPNRPAYGILLKSARQVLLKGPTFDQCAALGGDRRVPTADGMLFGVPARIWDIPSGGVAIDGWDEEPGGVLILDARGRAYHPRWT